MGGRVTIIGAAFALILGCHRDNGSLICPAGLEIQAGPTLVDPDGRAGLSRPLAMARMVDGRFLVVPSVQQGVILVFRSDGVFEGIHGRPGEGPGEYGVIRAIERRGGGVVVLDAGHSRLTELDGSLKAVREIPLQTPVGQMGLLRDGGSVLVGPARPEGAWGSRIFLLGARDSVLGPFLDPASELGSQEAPRAVRVTSDGERLVALGTVDERVVYLWSARGEYITKWSATTGTEPRSVPDAEDSPNPPRPRLELVRFDHEGRLWTVTDMPDADWSVNGVSRGPFGLPFVAEGDLDEAWDSLVEVWDPRSGELLAGARTDPSLLFLLHDGYAASYREDEWGMPSVETWRLQVDSTCVP